MPLHGPGDLAQAIAAYELGGRVRGEPRWRGAACAHRPMGGRLGHFSGGQSGTPRPFTPSSLALEGWYRGDSFADGTAIDLSGNGRDASALTGTVTQTTADGQLAFSFDGQSALHATYGTLLPQPLTLCFVLTPSALTATQFFFDSDDSANRVWCQLDTNPRYRVSAGATLSTTSATTKITALCVVLDGATSAIYMNDFKTPAAEDDSGQTGIDGVTIGAAFNGGSGFGGTISEAIIASGALDLATRTKLAGYLTALYPSLTLTT